MGVAYNGVTHCILSNNEDGICNSCEEKRKQELKGLKGQDRFFVKQMYQYRKDSLQKILGGKK